MDDIDRKLLILLDAEPRIHYRELARRLRISPQAVHHRIRILTKLGVIQPTRASISIAYLHAVPVGVYGLSRTKSIQETLEGLGESDVTHRVVVAGGNYIYVVGLLRKISDLDNYVDFVKRVAEMPDPIVAIYCLDDGLPCDYPVDGAGRLKQPRKELSPLDMKIIAALKHDVRKPIADITRETGASPKTVRRHLSDMISDGSMDISAPVDMPAGGDLFLVVHVNLRNSADRRKVGAKLLAKRYFQDQYIRTYSNLPDFLLWVFWSDKLGDIRRAVRETSDDEDVLSVMLNFAYLERMYASWRERLIEPPKSSSKKTAKGRSHS